MTEGGDEVPEGNSDHKDGEFDDFSSFSFDSLGAIG
jgi:hypothetical protein